MKITPYLNFAGDCREAMSFYQSVLGGELEMTAHKDTPSAEHVPAEMQNQIMHAVLNWPDGKLFASDAPMAQANSFSGAYLSVHPETVEEAERMFAALSEGGEVEMELEQTFWAKRFGMLYDRWGVKWMFNVD
ncbi:VOC family protein [Pelagibacterium halotolerans]|uniref:PhnB protein, putative DNA binding 3-demethylubiquinone-9 3-methyltransferase domain protein n=1 Tax=Pelagibacterium halotolerans (strain DSM 22347 / JCM 15775 / CGMCC 1.7692 / B2) TaxID=1082931 RepID=G4RE45_PELHB|nr:VOC family protein [Pelagibacterium halotolerans]AEQ50839.1 PhnB protein, putative DNA binding 3-demethylubiquinone-9 3-methyltransferase domain protein [Pelagibacterium halotolerans B2]QJR19247.1 VOC family protein [Pelagibacterium halotolerans]SDZ97634.1 PhnB protein [Pelagibacterium halotolerans]